MKKLMNLFSLSLFAFMLVASCTGSSNYGLQAWDRDPLDEQKPDTNNEKPEEVDKESVQERCWPVATGACSSCACPRYKGGWFTGKCQTYVQGQKCGHGECEHEFTWILIGMEG